MGVSLDMFQEAMPILEIKLMTGFESQCHIYQEDIGWYNRK